MTHLNYGDVPMTDDNYFSRFLLSDDPAMRRLIEEYKKSGRGMIDDLLNSNRETKDLIEHKIASALILMVHQTMPIKADQDDAIQLFAAATALQTCAVYSDLHRRMTKTYESCVKAGEEVSDERQADLYQAILAKAFGLMHDMIQNVYARNALRSQEMMAKATVSISKRHGLIKDEPR